MTSQVVWADIHSDTLSCLLDIEPGRSVANRKDTVIRLQPFFADVFLESVPDLLRNEDNFFLFAAFRRGPEDLSDHRKVAGIVQLRIARIADECEERGQRRVTGSLGSLLCAVADFRKEGEDFLGRDRFQIPVAESGRELG